VIALSSALLVGALTADARAADTPAGEPALKRARAAWDRGSLGRAEPLYREALEKGGLAPADVLEGYVRLGSIRAALGKKDSAVAAFRAASVLDASFSVPKEAGARGARLAEKAKRDTARLGSIQLAVHVPKDASIGKPFTVTATLDKAHLPIVNKISMVAKDGTTGKELSLEANSEESVEFEIGSEIMLPGASILVHVDALDSHQNRLASSEDRVRVPDRVEPVAAAVPPPPKSTATTKKETKKPVQGDPELRKGGAFWSSPWPYVIGGVALAGAGAAVYFGTRPAENISLGQVGVRTQ
jgi:hypothetical protein